MVLVVRTDAVAVLPLTIEFRRRQTLLWPKSYSHQKKTLYQMRRPRLTLLHSKFGIKIRLSSLRVRIAEPPLPLYGAEMKVVTRFATLAACFNLILLVYPS